MLSLLLTLACTGCGAVMSVQPLSDDSNSVLDERLYGQWQGTREDDRSILTIRHKPGTRATLELISESPGDEPERTIVFALRGPYHLLSARLEGERSRPAVYGVCRYRFRSPDILELYRLDTEIFARAVEGGTLRGEVRYSEPGPELAQPDTEPANDPPGQPELAEKEIREVVLNDGPERVLEFIRRNGDKSFHAEPGVLRRIVPAPRAAAGPSTLVVFVAFALGGTLAVALLLAGKRHRHVASR